MGCCCSAQELHDVHVTLVEKNDDVETESESSEDGDENRWECAICLSGKQHNTVATPCAHVFHKKCIVKWIRKSPTCPMCSTKILC